jgi:hypothetical protein
VEILDFDNFDANLEAELSLSSLELREYCTASETARSLPQRFQAPPVEPDSPHAGKASHFSKEDTPHVRRKQICHSSFV